MKPRRLHRAAALWRAPVHRVLHRDHGETFIEAIVSMSILALIMSVSAPAFVVTQKLNRQNQAAATTLSYAEKYIDDFRQALAEEQAKGADSAKLPVCGDVVTSFEALQRNSEANDWWGIPTESTAGKVEVWRKISNSDRDPSKQASGSNWFQINQSQQTTDFSDSGQYPETDDGRKIDKVEDLLAAVCTPDDDTKASGTLKFSVTVKSNVTAADSDDYVAVTTLETLGAVRYE